MKKQFNNRQSDREDRFPENGIETPGVNGAAVHSTLYAAEFMLYAFHFEDHDFDTRSKPDIAHPLMMLVTEG